MKATASNTSVRTLEIEQVGVKKSKHSEVLKVISLVKRAGLELGT